MFELVKGSSYVFLSRPRRFGKSLLLSTLKAYFEGKKELFTGLRIIDLEKDWKKHAVLHLFMSGSIPSDINSLKEILNRQFNQWEEEYE